LWTSTPKGQNWRDKKNRDRTKFHREAVSE
jgi:hypothetical protein